MKKINVFSCFLAILFFEIVFAYHYSVKFRLFLIVTLASTFIYVKMNTVFLLNQHGHGVLYPDKFKIMGFTIGKIIYFSIVTALIGTLMYIAFMGFEDVDISWTQTVYNIRFGVLTIAFTYAISFILWRMYWYEKLFYGSEYDARIEFQRNGDQNDVIEQKINKLKEQKILYVNNGDLI